MDNPFLILLSITLLIQSSYGSLSLQSTEFEKYVLPSCYKRDLRGQQYPLGQQSPAGPLGQSMENLISLIEKIENSREISSRALRPDQLAVLILSRFHIDDFGYNLAGNVGYFQQSPSAKDRSCLNEKLLLETTSQSKIDFPADILTEDEQCSMYFMLSHHVNQTARSSDLRTYSTKFSSPPISSLPTRYRSRIPQASMAATGYRMRTLTESPREQGAVSFRNNDKHAIAPARVLLGVIAGLANPTSTVGAMLGQPCNLEGCKCIDLQDTSRRDSQVDTLVAVTIADILAYGAGPSAGLFGTNEGPNFGATGVWNSSLCQVEYTLDAKSSRGTMAEIRGGLDGLVIGKAVRELMKDGVSMSLSSMLRQYYSPAGLKNEFSSVCQRRSAQTDLGSLKDQVRNYMTAFSASILNRASVSDGQVDAFINQYERSFQDSLNRAFEMPSEDREWCDSGRADSGNNIKSATCETPSEVVVMIDLDSELEKQMEIIKSISNGLDLRRRGSDMSVVANSKGGGYNEDDVISSDGLSRFAWNSTNRGCVTCRVAYADRSNFGSTLRNSPDQLLRAINVTMRDLKKGRADQMLTPGKSFVFFNFGGFKKPTGDRRRFDAEYSDLWISHRDVPLLMVGTGNSVDLKELAYNDETDIFEETSPDPDFLGKKILERVCKTPSTIQHPKCWTETSSASEIMGYVTPGRKQYWAMYPEYFIKSFNVEFKFTALTGNIKICYSRGYMEPEKWEENCKSIKVGDEPWTIYARNPCKGYGLYDCPVFYFTIFGEKEGATMGSGKCKKDACLNMDQIEFSLTHTGVQCNSSTGLISSIILLITAFIATRF